MFEESANHVFVSKIADIADDEMEAISPRLVSTSGGAVPAQADPNDGVVRPLSTSYQANVPLDNSLASSVMGSLVRLASKPSRALWRAG